MLKGPKIKLAVDLNRIGKYFPLGDGIQEGFGFDLVVDRSVYEEVAAVLAGNNVEDDRTILEICFLLLWIQEETASGQGGHFGRFHRMRAELDELNQYLMRHRITKVTFTGESGKNNGENEFQITEDINIDRLCDGLRCIFRDDFGQDPAKRKSKGLAAWRRRKLEKIRNQFLSYFTGVPELDLLSLEEQGELIDQLTELAGLK